MPADLVTKLWLDSKGFDNNIDKAISHLYKLKRQGNSSAYNIGELKKTLASAGATVGKFAAGVGLAVTASEGFNKVLRGSQTTGDELDKVMRSLNTTVDQLFTAISTMDFSYFDQGLSAIISKAREAQGSLDQLGNTTMSFNYFKSEYEAELLEAINNIKDESLPMADRQKAKQTADALIGKQEEITKVMRERSEDALKKMVAETNNLDVGDITMKDIDDILKIDVSGNLDDIKEVYGKQYEEWKKINSDMKAKYTKRTNVGGGMYGYTSDALDMDGYKNAMKEVNKEYKDAILFNDILVKHSDEWLQNLINTKIASDNAARSLESMKRRLLRGGKIKGKGESGVSGTSEIIPENSIKAMKTQISTLKHSFDMAADEGTRFGLKRAIEAAETQLAMMTARSDTMGLLSGGGTTVHGRNATEDILSGKNSIKQIEPTSLIDTDNSALEYLTAMGTLMGNLSGVTDNAAAAWLQYSANLISSIGAMLPAVASLFGLESALGIAEQSKLMFPLNIVAMAATAAGLAAAIASIPKFADGGIVPGYSFSGDKVPAMVNSGEMILNQGQQGNLFRMISEGGGRTSSVYVTGHLVARGRDLVAVLDKQNNFNERVR